MSNYKSKKSETISIGSYICLFIILAVAIPIFAYNLAMQKAYQDGVQQAYYDMDNTTPQCSQC